MSFAYFRCENCKAIVTRRQIKEKGRCPKCGKGRVNLAYFMGYNMPRPWEWLLIWLRMR